MTARLFYFLILFVLFNIVLNSCKQSSNSDTDDLDEKHQELMEDSAKFAETKNLQVAFKLTVQADFETDEVDAGINDDAADDPAVWFDASDWKNSKLLGTDKKYGIMVFDLNGKLLSYPRFGKVNNIDLRTVTTLGANIQAVVVGSNRTSQTLDIYSLNGETGEMKDIAYEEVKIPSDLIQDVYGVCMYKNKANELFAYINGKNGCMIEYALIPEGEKVKAIQKRHYQFVSQTEGMVADDSLGILYVGVEEDGIYKVNLLEEELNPAKIAMSSEENNAIKYDIEGLALYYKYDSSGYLLASSQGNFSYALFKREGENEYLGSFSITDGIVDGVEETDGLEISSFSFGSQFPEGFLIVQDGWNYSSDNKHPQNFKVVDWKKIKTLFDLR